VPVENRKCNGASKDFYHRLEANDELPLCCPHRLLGAMLILRGDPYGVGPIFQGKRPGRRFRAGVGAVKLTKAWEYNKHGIVRKPTPHGAFRATGCSSTMNAGGSMAYTADKGGHSTIDSVSRYANASHLRTDSRNLKILQKQNDAMFE